MKKGSERRRGMRALSHDCGRAVGAYADHSDLRADQLLNALHVLLGFFGEFFESAAGGDVAAPAGEALVNRFYIREGVHVGAEVVEALAAVFVGGADLDVV